MSWLHDAGAASGCLDVCSSPVKRLLPFLQVYGSVLPRALPYAIFGAVEGIVLKTMHHRGYNGFGLSYKEEWYDPYALSVFGIVLSFALSMRARVSYFRFWEGAVQCHQLTAKWADACMQVFAFDELSGDAYGEEAFEFRMLFAHFVSLMHACLLIHLRKDDELSLDELSLNMEDPYVYRCRLNDGISAKRVSTTGKTCGHAGERDSFCQAPAGGSARRSCAMPMMKYVAAPDAAGSAKGAVAEPSAASVAAALGLPRVGNTSGEGAAGGNGDELTAEDEEVQSKRNRMEPPSPTPAPPRSAKVAPEPPAAPVYDSPQSPEGSLHLDSAVRSPKPPHAQFESASGSAYGREKAKVVSVPLRRVLWMREQLKRELADEELNSFEPLDANVSLSKEQLASNLRAITAQASMSRIPPPGDRPGTPKSLAANRWHSSRAAIASRRFTKRSSATFEGDGASIPQLASAGSGADHDVSKARVKRGGLSRAEYANSVLFMRASNKTLAKLAKANCFDVMGGLSEAEMTLLLPIHPADRSFFVQTWLLRLMTQRLLNGGLTIHPAILSRVYQVLSDGTAAANQAHKIAFVAFPFPIQQLCFFVLVVFTFVAPYAIAAFTDSVALIGVVAFFTVLGYVRRRTPFVAFCSYRPPRARILHLRPAAASRRRASMQCMTLPARCPLSTLLPVP